MPQNDMRIYKYALSINDEQKITLPKYSKIISVIEQNGKIVLYAIINICENIKEEYSIIIHGTGHPANDILVYNFLGTVKMDNSLVFHVFYKKVKVI